MTKKTSDMTPDEYVAYRRREDARRARMTPEEKAARNAYCRQWQREHREAGAEWRRRNADRILFGRLKREFGLTPEDYASLLMRQGGHCAVCNRSTADQHKTKLCLDHDHKTGHVRGILCSRHNIAIGLCDDDPHILRALADYLEQYDKRNNEGDR